MKKLVFLTILLSSFAFGQNFVGKDAHLYKGAVIQVNEYKEDLQKYFFKNFFLEFDEKNMAFTKKESKNKPFPTGSKYSPTSNYKDLVGKEFEVINVFTIKSKFSTDKDRYFALQIRNEEIGEMFYKYDSKYDHNLEFKVISELNLPDDFYCKNIDKKEDKFNGSVHLFTPKKGLISFMKAIDGDKESVFISVTQFGKTLNVNEKGLYLLFEDGSKLEYPNAKIDVEATSEGYFYKAFQILSNDDIENLSTQLITDKKLYIYEGSIDKEDAIALKNYLKCLK